jgi:hypothetical protein
MTELRSGSYMLTFDTVVRAIVQAKNAYGWSSISDPNTEGARIQTEPLKVKSLADISEVTSI